MSAQDEAEPEVFVPIVEEQPERTWRQQAMDDLAFKQGLPIVHITLQCRPEDVMGLPVMSPDTARDILKRVDSVRPLRRQMELEARQRGTTAVTVRIK